MKKKAGFTLVEIVVVLVILAIMAAMGIPSLLGFIEDARRKMYVAEARTCWLAAQSVCTKQTALGKKIRKAGESVNAVDANGNKIFFHNNYVRYEFINDGLIDFTNLLNPDIQPNSNCIIKVRFDADGKLIALLYKPKADKGLEVLLTSDGPAQFHKNTSALGPDYAYQGRGRLEQMAFMGN